jgi:hypothetical protein
LVRLLFNRFRWLLLGFCAAAMAAEPPQVAVKVDLTSTIGNLSQYSSVAFLTDRLLLISNGQSSPTSVLYDIDDRKVIRTGKTCGVTGLKVWGTFSGSVLAACNGGLVLYDQEFRPIAHFSAALKTYDLLLSPTRRFLAVNPLPRRGAAKVLTTDTLAEIATFPSKSGYIINLSQAGYIVYDGPKGKEGWEISFYPFADLHPQSLVKSNKNCGQAGFGISESEFVSLACGKERGKIIDITTGKVRVEVSDAGQADFAQATEPGKRFALGYEDYSKAHVVKQLANPLTYIGALGTCCDDPSNLIRLRIFDQESGNLLTEFHWKTSKKEPPHDYRNSAVTLSPNGKYVAFLRGVLVEVYRIQDKPS